MHPRSVDSRLLFAAVVPCVYRALSWLNVGAREKLLELLEAFLVAPAHAGLEVKPRRVGALLLLAARVGGLCSLGGCDEVFSI